MTLSFYTDSGSPASGDVKAWEAAKALGLPLTTQLAMYIYSMPGGCFQNNQQIADALGVTVKRLVLDLGRMVQAGQIVRVTQPNKYGTVMRHLFLQMAPQPGWNVETKEGATQIPVTPAAHASQPKPAQPKAQPKVSQRDNPPAAPVKKLPPSKDPAVKALLVEKLGIVVEDSGIIANDTILYHVPVAERAQLLATGLLNNDTFCSVLDETDGSDRATVLLLCHQVLGSLVDKKMTDTVRNPAAVLRSHATSGVTVSRQSLRASLAAYVPQPAKAVPAKTVKPAIQAEMAEPPAQHTADDEAFIRAMLDKMDALPFDPAVEPTDYFTNPGRFTSKVLDKQRAVRALRTTLVPAEVLDEYKRAGPDATAVSSKVLKYVMKIRREGPYHQLSKQIVCKLTDMAFMTAE